MSTTRQSAPTREAQQMLETLRQAVAKTLEKKRRLGHYAVWQHGKPVMIGDDAPQPNEPAR